MTLKPRPYMTHGDLFTSFQFYEKYIFILDLLTYNFIDLYSIISFRFGTGHPEGALC